MSQKMLFLAITLHQFTCQNLKKHELQLHGNVDRKEKKSTTIYKRMSKPPRLITHNYAGLESTVLRYWIFNYWHMTENSWHTFSLNNVCTRWIIFMRLFQQAVTRLVHQLFMMYRTQSALHHLIYQYKLACALWDMALWWHGR